MNLALASIMLLTKKFYRLDSEATHLSDFYSLPPIGKGISFIGGTMVICLPQNLKVQSF